MHQHTPAAARLEQPDHRPRPVLDPVRIVPPHREPEPREPRRFDDLGWLRKPLVRKARFKSHRGQYRIRVYDQPGRWMSVESLGRLHRDLRHVAERAMDAVPTYGIFTGRRESYRNRVFAVAADARTGEPVGFTAMVYLPVEQGGRTEPVIHLGLTMIHAGFRGQRLQTPLFKRVFLLPFLNQRRLAFTITNIAASPAGIGAMSDYFQDVYPTYRGDSERTAFHLDVARQVLGAHRHEFGCSVLAAFDLQSFVVRGSNDPMGGGAQEFIKEDPVSRYRVEACNDFCLETLDTPAGDELFQVGRVHALRSSVASRRSKRRISRRAARWTR